MCLLTHERYKTYQRGFSFGRLGHAPGVGLGYHGGSNFLFPKFKGGGGGLGEGREGQILLNLNYKVNFKGF